MEKFIRKPLRTVLLLQDLEFGGTQRYAVQLLKHLDRGLFDPELWVMRGGADMLPLVRQANAPCSWMSNASYVWPHALARLAQKLIRSKPHILYTLTGVPNIWGRFLGSLVGIPVIIASWRGLVERQLETLLWRLSTKMICNAEILKAFIVNRHGVDPSRIEIVPNAVDTEAYKPERQGKSSSPSILYVGRLVWEKDPSTLIEAFRIVLKRAPVAQLEIVGNGPMKSKIEFLLKKHSLENHVNLVPGSSDIRPHLHKAWLFAMSSVSEASPNVILEAMSSGLPVVATRVGGIPELVVNEETGLIVSPGSPEEMAAAMIRIITDTNLRETLGSRSRQRVLQAYSIDRMMDLTQQVFLEAVKQRIKENPESFKGYI
jgi:glycosyltransferase involved in cell wall biosynthesis